MSEENEMTTEQIEKLYIEHAKYFRELLGDTGKRATSALALLSETPKVVLCNAAGTWFYYNGVVDMTICAESLAVAAMESAWRQRLEKEYEVYFARRLFIGNADPTRKVFEVGCWHATRNTPREGRKNYLGHDGFVDRTDKEAGFKTLAETICATVKALVEEKRAAAKEQVHLEIHGIDFVPDKGPEGNTPFPNLPTEKRAEATSAPGTEKCTRCGGTEIGRAHV